MAARKSAPQSRVSFRRMARTNPPKSRGAAASATPDYSSPCPPAPAPIFQGLFGSSTPPTPPHQMPAGTPSSNRFVSGAFGSSSTARLPSGGRPAMGSFGTNSGAALMQTSQQSSLLSNTNIGNFRTDNGSSNRYVEPNLGRSASPSFPPTSPSYSPTSPNHFYGRGGAPPAVSAQPASTSAQRFTLPTSIADKVLALIELQDFDGFWASESNKHAFLVMGVTDITTHGEHANVWLTVLVIKFLEEKCTEEQGTWELVVEKARAWLDGCGYAGVEELEKKAGEVIG